MKQLQKQFYERKEIAEMLELDVNDSKHFKRNLENKLIKWGYSYEYSRKGITITKQPETAEEKLSEIIVRKYDLDIQLEVNDFAYFIYCLLADEAFISMPWAERVNYLKEEYNVSVSESTLKRWGSKLIDMNLVSKDKVSRTYWTTFYIDGEKQRVKVDNEQSEKAMRAYMEYRNQMKNEFVENGKRKGRKDYAQLNSDAWKFAMSEAWEKFHACYYACGTLCLNAIGEDAQEIYELVEEICGDGVKKTTVLEVSTRLVTKFEEFIAQPARCKMSLAKKEEPKENTIKLKDIKGVEGINYWFISPDEIKTATGKVLKVIKGEKE